MPAPNEITVKQLNRLIGTPDCPAIVDVCIDPDFAEDPFLIPGSFRHPHTEVDALTERLQRRRTVIVCQKGKKLSQGVTAWLQSEGVDAEYLQGGMYGWRDDPETERIPAKTLPKPVGGSTLWVTRQRPKIDRIACPWLIRRFVDADARFLFVSSDEVAGVADRFGATPFDVEDAPFAHDGDRCTFDALLDAFCLHTPALDRLAQVIRAADTNRHDLAPEAAGLLALSVGLSRQYRDDTQQLMAGLPIYDALYRWARDGSDEGHGHP
ncbi:MAG: chromate resistance protein [Paracoccaceae bacterium]|nr:chromate resistance protein [Paracoccaceae bacterium]